MADKIMYIPVQPTTGIRWINELFNKTVNIEYRFYDEPAIMDKSVWDKILETIPKSQRYELLCGNWSIRNSGS